MTRKGYAGGPLPRYLLLFSVVFLTLFGLVMIYSAASVSDYVNFGDSAYHVKRQLRWAGAGVVFMLIMSRIDYHHIKKLVWPFLAVANVMLVLVLTHGSAKWGAQRWLNLGPVAIQPSEFAKLAVILALALVLSDRKKRGAPFGEQMMWYGVVTLPVLGLIMAQPDMGTTMTIVVAAYVLLLLGGIAGRYLLGTAVAISAAIPVMIALEPYRMARFTSFLDPWKDPLRDGYQIIQALYAFASGGVTGVGLGLSRQKYFYLPAAHTDFIYAIIGEELGLIGTLAIVAAFIVMAYAGIRIAMGARDRFGKLLAGGVTALIVMQAVMNIAAVTALMPVTGITLPLVSYGGSSVMFTFGCIGLILSVSRNGLSAQRRQSGERTQEEERSARIDERRGDGRPRLSSIDGGRAPVRRRA